MFENIKRLKEKLQKKGNKIIISKDVKESINEAPLLMEILSTSVSLPLYEMGICLEARAEILSADQNEIENVINSSIPSEWEEEMKIKSRTYLRHAFLSTIYLSNSDPKIVSKDEVKNAILANEYLKKLNK